MNFKEGTRFIKKRDKFSYSSKRSPDFSQFWKPHVTSDGSIILLDTDTRPFLLPAMQATRWIVILDAKMHPRKHLVERATEKYAVLTNTASKKSNSTVDFLAEFNDTLSDLAVASIGIVANSWISLLYSLILGSFLVRFERPHTLDKLISTALFIVWNISFNSLQSLTVVSNNCLHITLFFSLNSSWYI